MNECVSEREGEDLMPVDFLVEWTRNQQLVEFFKTISITLIRNQLVFSIKLVIEISAFSMAVRILLYANSYHIIMVCLHVFRKIICVQP